MSTSTPIRPPLATNPQLKRNQHGNRDFRRLCYLIETGRLHPPENAPIEQRIAAIEARCISKGLIRREG